MKTAVIPIYGHFCTRLYCWELGRDFNGHNLTAVPIKRPVCSPKWLSQTLLLVISRTSRNGWVHTHSTCFIHHMLTSDQILTQRPWKHLFFPPKTQPNGQFQSSGMSIGLRGIMSSVMHWARVVLLIAQKGELLSSFPKKYYNQA